MENICRVCLGFDAIINLFEDNPSPFNGKLVPRFKACTQIQITEDDSLPKYVCVECANRINYAFELKELAQNSDRELKRRRCVIENDQKTNPIAVNNVDDDGNDSNDLLYSKDIKIEDVEYPTFENVTKLENDAVKPVIKTEKGPYSLKKKKRKKIDGIKKENRLKRKINQLTEAVNLQCTICCVEFKHKTSLLKHMRQIHSLKGYGRAKDYMCDTCGKTYFDQYGLQLHKRSHTGQRPFKCDICGQGFSQLHNMNRHILAKHQKDKPYKCEVCGKNFGYLGTLQQHKRQHYEAQKNYQCSICQRQFNRIFSLRRHKLTHSQAKPYVCKHCNRPYSQSNNLKMHMKKSHPEQSAEHFSEYCAKQNLEDA